MSFSPAQQAIYRPLVERAWRADCARTGCSPEADGARETWYRRQLNEVCGVFTTRELNGAEDLDRLLIHFAGIAGDEAMLIHATRSHERRVLYVIRQKIGDLARLEGREVTWDYVRAIYAQMNRHHLLPERISDCPADLLRKVIQALDKHVRRVRRQIISGARHAA